MKSSKSKATAWLLLAAVIAVVAFIWFNSLEPPELSSEKSGRVTAWLTPLLELVVGEGNVTEHLVRKMAHFGEFFLLGIVLTSLISGRIKSLWTALITCLFCTLLIAMIDETIQLFTDRGSQLKDVWLDFAGGSAGVALVLLVRSLSGGNARRK